MAENEKTSRQQQQQRRQMFQPWPVCLMSFHKKKVSTLEFFSFIAKPHNDPQSLIGNKVSTTKIHRVSFFHTRPASTLSRPWNFFHLLPNSITIPINRQRNFND